MKSLAILKLRFIFLSVCFFSLSFLISQVNIYADTSIRVMIDGTYLKSKVAVVVDKSGIWLPLIDTFKKVEFKVAEEGATVKIIKGTKRIVVNLEDKTVRLNGNQLYLISSVKSIDGKPMILAKLIQKLFNCNIKWDANRQIVLINMPFKPVSIFTFNHYITYSQIPKKVVSMNSHTTEVMIALGLEKKIIGTAYNNTEIRPKYKAKFDKLPVLAKKYPSFEVLLDTGADFVYGRSSVFDSRYRCASMEDMITNGIKPYVAKASYTKNADFNDVYEDFINLGKIFNIENKTALFVADMRVKILEVTQKVNAVRPVKVFVYDFGKDDAFTAGKSLETYIIQTAGGKNIFDDIDKTWAHVNWEIVVDRNPDYIVINDYGKTTAQEKINYLKSNPILKNIDAVMNNRFVIVPLSSVFPGIRITQSTEEIAKGLHPEVF